MKSSIPVVILCGGQGTRLRSEMGTLPKPLVEVGGKPILWHIMTHYSQFGFNEFVLCLGYQGHLIKDYFINYELMSGDFTITLGHTPRVQVHRRKQTTPWKVTLIDTGEDTMTGGRLKRAQPHIKAPQFMLTYGDGIGNINIQQLLAFHEKHGKIGTVTGVRPPSRFGELMTKDNTVVEFSEKPQTHEGYINGGFFVFKRSFLERLSEAEDLVLEREPLERLAEDRELMVNRHQGFWQCMDTYRDYKLLNSLWAEGNPPWVVKHGR